MAHEDADPTLGLPTSRMPMPNEPEAGSHMRPRVAIVGGSGFIGSAVAVALQSSGAKVKLISAPRIVMDTADVPELITYALASPHLDALRQEFLGSEVVINAAGIADAAATSEASVYGANSVLPRLIREAAVGAGARRFIHISSAGVQGRLEPLDESPNVAPFSLYTRSKALGEQALQGCPETVIFRPTSVQGRGRAVTDMLARVATSRIASVAGRGERPTPQVLLENVADAISFVAHSESQVPSIVLQPWGGLTTGGLLSLLGGSHVRAVPVWLARSITRVLAWSGRFSNKTAAMGRRLEMLWLGQSQVEGWLRGTAWKEPAGIEEWGALAGSINSQPGR